MDEATHRKALERPDRREELFAYRGRPSQNVLIAVDGFRRDVTGLSEGEIHKYLQENAIQCTEAADLARLANLIHRYLGEHGGANGRGADRRCRQDG